MKAPGISKFVTLLLLGWWLTVAAVGAQGFGLSAFCTSTSAPVNGSVTYFINLTNRTGLLLADVFVTNTFSSQVIIQYETNSPQSVIVKTNANLIYFELGQFLPNDAWHLGMIVQVLTNGFLTNTIVATAPGDFVTNSAPTNLVVQVTNAVTQADLAVAITGPSVEVFAGDWMTYSVAVTNLGPSVVTNVFLTNTLPVSVGLIAPTNQIYRLTNGVMVLNLGTLTNQGYQTFNFTVQPTNAGVLPFLASLGAAGLQDTNTANNTASNNITVPSLGLGQLIATNLSAMTLDPQTGLMNQTIRLANISATNVASARVIISGLTNRLYNAVGTNNGNPFVIYGTPLAAGQSTDLVLEYFVPTRLPIVVSNSFYTAFGVAAVTSSAPVGTNGSYLVKLKKIYADGNVLLEFSAESGRSYTIVYSADGSFATPFSAQPAILATANQVQWIDNGPPKTISPPAHAGARFYRVYLNP